MKLTIKQVEALRYIGARRQVMTGYLALGGHGIAGPTFAALARRGLVTSSFNALFNNTYHEITDKGREVLRIIEREGP